MALVLFAICVIGLVAAVWIKRIRERQELDRHSITPEGLRELMQSRKRVLLFDVRLPLDLLANSEIIPRATRLTPREIRENPSLLPRERDSIVYCTCPNDKTSRAILRRALNLGFTRVRFLRGGLTAWKARGFPVEPYQIAFHLDTGT
jgi:rhodanese-related sulfurtransferase